MLTIRHASTVLSEPLKLHIENLSKLGEVFEITEERLDKALNRHPELSNKLAITIGYDGRSFASSMRSANVLFGWDFERKNLARIAPELQWIHLHGAGVNHLLPLDWVPHNVQLTNSRGAHGAKASEYLIMSILALNNRLPKMINNQQQKEWVPIHSDTVSGKTLLIYGVGNIGGSVATLAKQFGMRVLGIRRTNKPHEHVDEMHPPEALETLLPEADIILVTAPHTPITEFVFGKHEFGLMKQGAGFINYSRANLVDYDVLLQALNGNRIAAVVDVFHEEPLPPTSPLWEAPNLIITPHSSSNDPEHLADRSLEILFENIKRFLNGDELKNKVDFEQLY